MKKYALPFLLALFLSTSIHAQTDVYLKIDHMLGSSPFAFNQTASNNLGNNYQVTRLEYYLSEITLTHDGGQVTPVPNTWLILDAGTPTNELLGNFNVTNLESIGFTVGVDSSVNHNDPALWPVGHPLALRTPSMHWGWVGGYRFVAIEGNTGQNLNENYQIHALGDVNYYPQTIATSGLQTGNGLSIELEADYTMALKDITVAPGLFNHGENQEAQTLLLNFQNSVFRASGTATAVAEMDAIRLAVYPNPSDGQRILVGLSQPLPQARIQVTDIAGRVVLQQPLSPNNQLEIQLEQAGCYFLSVLSNDEVKTVKKLIVTK